MLPGVMSNGSKRTVWVALLAGLAVTLSKVGAAIITSSPAMAAEASHSLADNGNDLFLLIAQRRSARPRDE
jgi:divalent metal cation (Fe/Co/Zn/Cd) transporter